MDDSNALVIGYVIVALVQAIHTLGTFDHVKIVVTYNHIWGSEKAFGITLVSTTCTACAEGK